MPNHFGYEMIRDLPAQIEKFFEVMRFDLDVTQQISMTPMANKMIDFASPQASVYFRQTPSASIVQSDLLKMNARDSFAAIEGGEIQELPECNEDEP